MFRRFRVAPGVTLNVSKAGPSVSIGPRGAKFTIGSTGARETLGAEGVYLTNSQRATRGPARLVLMLVALAVAALAFFLGR